jgi:hypothetical protein
MAGGAAKGLLRAADWAAPYVDAALNRVPGIAKFDQGAREVQYGFNRSFRPFANVRIEAARKAAAKGATPQAARAAGAQAEHAARTIATAAQEGSGKAHQLLAPVWRGTTPAERVEIERRSEGLASRPATGKLGDAELDSRAQQYRALLQQRDHDRVAAGLTDQQKLVQGFTPRPLAHAGYSQTAATDYDRAKGLGLLPEDYDPANNAIRAFSDTYAQIEQQQAGETLRALGLSTPLEYKTASGTSMGYGTPGRRAASNYAGREGNQAALLRAGQELGIPTRQTAAGQTELVGVPRAHATGEDLARVAEARRSGAQLGRYAQRVQGAATQSGQRATAALDAQHAKLVADAQRTLRSATATAAQKVRAQADLQQAALARQRAVAEQRLGAKLPQHNPAFDPEASGPGPRLTPEQTTLAKVLAPVSRLGEQAGNTVDAIEKAGQSAAEGLAARAARQAARTPAQAAAITAPVRVVASAILKGDAAAQARVAKLSLQYASRRMERDLATTLRQRQAALRPRAIEDIRAPMMTGAKAAAKAAGYETTRTPGGFGSLPVFQDSALTRSLADFLEDEGARPPEAKGIASFFDRLNSMARVGIIANPTVHVLWNYNNQFLAAGGSPADLVDIYNFTKPFDQRLIDEAREAGAILPHQRLGEGVLGGDYATMIGSSEGLSLAQKIDRGLTGAWNANQQLVFKTFEERYAAKLYQRFVQHGLTPEEAGVAVRKALGDYQNVARHGPEQFFSRAFFFYPWLKTIVPFWTQTLIEAPQYVTAPIRGLQVNNEGDPNADAISPYTVAWGGGNYTSLPFPQRVLEQFAPLLSGDFQAVTRGLANIAESHATPLAGAAMDTYGTLSSSAQEPQPGGHILWNKDAPTEQRNEQLVGNEAERALPLPIQARSLIDYAKGLPSNPNPFQSLGGIGATSIVGGTSYRRPSPEASRAIWQVQDEMEDTLAQMRRSGSSQEEMESVYQTYLKALHGLQKSLTGE